MNNYDTAATACPYCGTLVNHALAVSGDRSPEVGDVSVCLTCAAIAVYQSDQTLRRTTDQERREFSLSPVVIRTQLAIAGIPDP